MCKIVIFTFAIWLHPFDQMPFATSLMNHNPKLSDLFECLNPSGREHELLAELIKNNTENNGILYTPKKDIGTWNNIDTLISKYNKALYTKHMVLVKLKSSKNIFI